MGDTQYELEQLRKQVKEYSERDVAQIQRLRQLEEDCNKRTEDGKAFAAAQQRVQAVDRRNVELEAELKAKDCEARTFQRQLESWRSWPLLAVRGSTPALHPRPHLVPEVQKLLRSLVPSDHQGPCLKIRSLVVDAVEEILNIPAWKKYCSQ